MLSKAPAAGFAIGVAIRALLIAALAFAALLAAQRGLFASSLVLVGLVLLIAFDIGRLAHASSHAMVAFIDGLDADGAQWPAMGKAGRDLAGPMERVRGRLVDRQSRARSQIDHMQGLLDSVGAALLVASADGPPIAANRAARLLLGEGLAAQVLGEEASARLAAMRPGGSEILRLADGSSRLASCSGFMAPGEAPRRLIALQKLAGDLDAVQLKAWQDLVRVLSHELMNSLTAICSLAEAGADRLRRSQAEPADLSEVMEVIARRSGGLMDFVGRYRRVADLPAPRIEPVAAGELAQALGGLMGAQMQAAGVAYDSRIEPAGLVLNADRGLIEQAAINLLKNALDAVRNRPGGRVELSIVLGDEGVALTVADNGPGLSEAAQEALFVPFFTTKADGSGIGLTLARQIAQAHGGHLDYAGDEGGARFVLSLPA
ncbi:MAG: histidine kinase [Caulobacteraceae bacterium]|nr:histidine kinase [Caulobacteraceae bacterium]